MKRLRMAMMLLLLLAAASVAVTWWSLDRLDAHRPPRGPKPAAPSTHANPETNREPSTAQPEEPVLPSPEPHGRLRTLQGYRVLTLQGTPAQMGRAAGRLLGPTIRRVIREFIREGIARDADAYRNLLAGSAVMAGHQPAAYRAELEAMALAAEVDYEDLLLLQYHGDVRRCITGPGAGSLCTSFAVLPPATADEVCLVGRNLDYFDNGISEYATVLVHYKPAGKIPFLTVTWAGIINGWSLLSEKGLFASNNTAYEARHESLEGISTCFLLRRIVEDAATLEEALQIVRIGPRACGTNLLIAQGAPPDAALVEFDHKNLAVRRPVRGFVGAANAFSSLYQEQPAPRSPRTGRCGRAWAIVEEHFGRITFATEIAGAEGVPIPSMNLHCATIDVTRRRLRIAMGPIPAYRLPAKTFRLTPSGVTSDPSAP